MAIAIKRVAAVVLSALLAFSLAGCGSDSLLVRFMRAGSATSVADAAEQAGVEDTACVLFGSELAYVNADGERLVECCYITDMCDAIVYSGAAVSLQGYDDALAQAFLQWAQVSGEACAVWKRCGFTCDVAGTGSDDAYEAVYSAAQAMKRSLGKARLYVYSSTTESETLQNAQDELLEAFEAEFPQVKVVLFDALSRLDGYQTDSEAGELEYDEPGMHKGCAVQLFAADDVAEQLAGLATPLEAQVSEIAHDSLVVAKTPSNPNDYPDIAAAGAAEGVAIVSYNIVPGGSGQYARQAFENAGLL